MELKKFTFLLALVGLGSMALAQRGLPPKEKTRSILVTKHAQHLDFLPQLVKLLKVPDGWLIAH